DWRTGQNDEARRHGLEALEMMQSAMLHEEQSSFEPAQTELPTRTSLAVIGNPLELAHCHGLLGIVDATLSYNTEALRHLRLAQEIFERHDNVTDLTLIYGNMGAVYTTIADYATGRIFFQRALDMAKRSNNLPIITFVAGNLGDVEARCGNLHAAEAWTRQSLEIAEQINDPEQESWAHILLGSVLLDLGRMDESLKHIRRGLAMGHTLKSVLCVGYALVTLGEWRTTRAFDRSNLGFLDRNALAQPGEHKRLLAQAKKTLRRAIALDGLNMEIVTEGRLCLARAHFLLGEVEEAHSIALESLRSAESHDITRTIARARRLLGRIVALQEHFEEAETSFIEATELFSRHGMRLDQARTLYSSGASLLQSSPTGSTAYQHCLDNLHEARDIFQHCGAANDLAWVERILNSAQYARAGI
ncbi:MAG TPA: tetratricopeptide repeat protein, partial [Ktedonobacteraceae bacterium]|nr:tetratricopeptide repeat protein [Ktedonobacteraceae bacterium]